MDEVDVTDKYLLNRDKDEILVYALKCPIDNRVRYIGITRSALSRFFHHIRSMHHGDKGRWIKRIYRKGYLPKMMKIAIVEKEKAAKLVEEKWIKKYANTRHEIFNKRHVES